MLGRYVAKFRAKAAVIDDIVGLAPSSHGTTNPLAPGAGLFCPACAEQAAGSAFMKKLNAAPEAPPPPSYTVISTKLDEVVTPYRSQALEGATNVVLQDRCPEDITDHVGIIYDPIALQWTLNALGRPGPADPAFIPLCSDAASSRLPFAFVARRRANLAGDNAGVRVTCTAAVGRCTGRVQVRDRARRLGTAPFDLAPGAARTIQVPVRREPRGRTTATVVTLQPGGYVKAALRLRRSDDG
jgi:hypothetical protein